MLIYHSDLCGIETVPITLEFLFKTSFSVPTIRVSLTLAKAVW